MGCSEECFRIEGTTKNHSVCGCDCHSRGSKSIRVPPDPTPSQKAEEIIERIISILKEDNSMLLGTAHTKPRIAAVLEKYAKEKAEEIAHECAPCYGTGDTGPTECSAMSKCELHYRIAAALEQYHEDGILVGMKRQSSETTESILRRERADGYRQAIEDAAKMIENWWCEPKDFVKKMADKVRGLAVKAQG